jgi:cytochrome b
VYFIGYSACVLVLFRLKWGVVGTRYARFTQFLKGPAGMIEHAKGPLSGNEHSIPGHNPVGGIVMVDLMLLVLLIGLTGYLSVKEILGDLMGEAHEAIASIALAAVVIHIAAAIIMSLLQKENLIRSMVTGKKEGLPDQAIRFPQYLIGFLVVLGSSYCFYMILTGAVPGLTQ